MRGGDDGRSCHRTSEWRVVARATARPDVRYGPVMRGAVCLVLVGSIACGRTRQPTKAPIAEVEPLFDTPREFRRHAALPCGVGAGLIYVFTSSGELYAFDPPTLQFRRIGPIACPGAG